MGTLRKIGAQTAPKSFQTEKRAVQPAARVDTPITQTAREGLQTGTLPISGKAADTFLTPRSTLSDTDELRAETLHRNNPAVPLPAQAKSVLRDVDGVTALPTGAEHTREHAASMALERLLEEQAEHNRALSKSRRERDFTRTAELQEETKALNDRLMSAYEGAYDEGRRTAGQRFGYGMSSIAQTAGAALPVLWDTARQYISNNEQQSGDPRRAELAGQISQLVGRLDYLERYKYPTRYAARQSEEWKALDAERTKLREALAALDVNTPVSMDAPGMQMMTEAIETREKALAGTEGVPRFLGETAISIGQNLALMPTAAISPAVPLAAMGAIAAADKTYELNSRGVAPGEALTRGLVSGGIEAATEKIPLDNLLDLVKTGGRSAVRSLLRQMGTEATEESVSYVLNYLADEAAKDPEAEFSLQELAEAAAGGGLSGGVQSGGAMLLGRAMGGNASRPAQEAPEAANSQTTALYAPAAQQTQKTASTGETGTYRAARPENVELPTVPIINLSMQTVADMNGGTMPKAGNYIRKTALEQTEARLGLDKNPAAYIEASNVTRNGDAYVIKITKPSLKKMLSAGSYSDRVVPLESIAVLGQLERIAQNGVYFSSEGDRRGRAQIAGYDHLMTTVYIDGSPYLVDMRVRVEDQKAGGGNRLYHFTPEAIEVIKKNDGAASTAGRHATSVHSTDTAPSSTPIIADSSAGGNTQSVQAELLSYAGRALGESGARALTAAYAEGTDPASYYAGFTAYYNAGLTGAEQKKVRGEYASALTEAQRFAAYSAGQNDAALSLKREQRAAQTAPVYGGEAGFMQSEHSAHLSKETVRAYNSLARAAGVKIRMEASTGEGGANGWYKDGIIHIAADAEKPGIVVAKHEVTHHMQETAPEAYRKYRDYAVNALADQAGSSVSLVEQYKRRYAENDVALSTEEAMDEIAADFTEALAVDPARFEALAKDDRSVARKVLDAVRDFLHKVKSLFKGGKSAQNQAAAEAYGVSVDTLDEAARLWAEALETANRRAAVLQGKANGATMSETKLSLKDMSEDETAALLQYKSSESYRINAKLRDGLPLTEAEQKMVADLDSALEKLPKVKGTVYRTLNFDAVFNPEKEFSAFVEQHAEGALVDYNAFTSTSTKADGYPLTDGAEYGVTIEISSSSARDLAGFGNNFESEALFPRETAFIVRSVSADKTGYTHIVMEEVQDNAKRNEPEHDTQKRGQAVQQVQKAGELHRNVPQVSGENTARGADRGELPGVRGEGEGNEVVEFSLKGGDILKENAALQRENELLRERVDYWKGQTRRTQRVTTDKKTVTAAAKQLIRNYHAGIAVDDILGDLQSLYDYIASGYDGADELTYTEARRRAKAVGRKVVESALDVDGDGYRQYADLRSYLRGQKLRVPRELWSGLDRAGGYNAFRNANMGRLSLSSTEGAGIDQVYQALAEEYPEFFDERRTADPADQLIELSDVLDGLYRVEESNPFAGYMDQAVTGAANEIMELFFDLPQVKRTFADRQAQKLDAAKARGRQQVQQVREQRDAKLAELREENRERVRRAVQRERDTRARQLGRLKDRYAARDAAGRERARAAELRRKITRHAKALSQKLLRPTDKRHIPENLRKAVAAMLESINQESQYAIDPGTGKRVKNGDGLPAKRTKAFLEVKEQYAKIAAEGGDMVIDPALLGSGAEGFQGNFDAVIAMREIRLADMSAEQLTTVWQVVKAVEHSVSMAGKILSKTKFATTADWANALQRDTASRRNRKSLTGKGLVLDLEDPYTFFSHYGEAGKAVYRMLRDAQDRETVMKARVTEAARKAADPKTVKKLEETTRTFTTERGEELTLSTAQIMELYELMKRTQAHDHLLKGGVVQPEIKSAKIRRGTDAILLTAGDLAGITGTLTEGEIKIADGLQRLTCGLLADYGNRASMDAYGYKKFTEQSYWPIQSAKEGVRSSVERGGGQTRSISNIGFAQAVTPHANNPLDLPGIFTTFASHAGDMLDYGTWLLPMEDANRLFNFKFRDGEGNLTGKTIKGLLDRVGGEGSQRYWHNLMEDIQNGLKPRNDSSLTALAGKAVGSFKGAAVGGNLRVVIQQPTAFFRAGAVLSYADLSRGLARGATRGDGWEKALQYAPIAMQKDLGGFDISAPASMYEALFDGRSALRKTSDAMGWAAGKADAVTWGRLWNACEWATARERPELRKGSDAFYRAVSRSFTEVIDQTQVVDGVLQRSNIMRSGNALAQQATTFMGEPVKALNVLLRAYDRMRYEQDPQKRGKAIQGLGRAATALVVTNIVNALAQSVIDAMRDDDEDKKYWERFRVAFTGITGEEKSAWDKAYAAVFNGNVGGNMNLLGNVPFAKDLLSLAQGYDVSRTEMEIFSDLIRAGQTAAQSAGGSGKKTRAYAAKELLAAGAKVFGIPAGNLARDIWGFIRSVTVETDNIPLQYEMEKAIYNITNDGNKGRYYDILFRALAQEDTDSYQHIRRDLMEQMGVDGASIDSAMRSRYKKAMEADSDFTMSQSARDLLGIREQYAQEQKSAETFGAKDLTPTAYQAYSKQQAQDYREWADTLEGYRGFSVLEDAAKDAALENAAKLAEDLALRDHSGGRVQDADLAVWERWATQGGDYGVDETEAILFKTAYDMAESDKDKNGKAISGSKKENTLEQVDSLMPWLTDEELDYLMSGFWTPRNKELKTLRENQFLE